MLVRECTSGALDEALEALGDLFGPKDLKQLNRKGILVIDFDF